MLETLGARLRQRREQQGIALRTIADETKIKLSLLEALERDDISQWPAGIFRRAYIRTYAQAIALNPDEVVREFTETYPEPVDVAAIEEIASLADGARSNGGPQTRLRHIMGSALGSFSWRRRGAAAEEPLVASPAHGTNSITLRPSTPAGRPVADDLHFIGLPPAPTARAAEADAVEEPAVVPGQDPSIVEPPVDPGACDVTPAISAAVEPAISAELPAEVTRDFMAVADLCTEFGRVGSIEEVRELLREAARILDATGLIIWVWDPSVDGLRPALAHGYSDRMLAHLPTVPRDADNATAAAFRAAQTCVIPGSPGASGALVVPMLTADGCAGVLAIELPGGAEQQTFVRAGATILGALLTQFVGARTAEAPAAPEAAAPSPVVAQMPPPRLRASAGR